MTVTIKKVGRVPELRPFDLKCRRCSTEFSCHLADLRPSPDPRDNDVMMIDCPQCYAGIWFTPEARQVVES